MIQGLRFLRAAFFMEIDPDPRPGPLPARTFFTHPEPSAPGVAETPCRVD